MCVHIGSGAVGKVSKPVAAVVSVAVCYTVPNVSYVGIIATSTLPRPCPVKTLTLVYMCVSVTSDLMCVSSV